MNVMMKYIVILLIFFVGMMTWVFLSGFDRSMGSVSNKIQDYDIHNMASSVTETPIE